jgi:hypothetical protein
VRHGRRVRLGNKGEAPYGSNVRLTFGDDLLAIAEPRGDELQPVVVFAPA